MHGLQSFKLTVDSPSQTFFGYSEVWPFLEKKTLVSLPFLYNDGVA